MLGGPPILVNPRKPESGSLQRATRTPKTDPAASDHISYIAAGDEMCGRPLPWRLAYLSLGSRVGNL